MDRIGYYGHEILVAVSVAIEYLYVRVRIHAYTTSQWIFPLNKLSTVLTEFDAFLVDLDGHVIGFRSYYDDIVNRLNAILDLDGLEYLLNKIFSEWQSFRSEPREYISGKLSEMLHTWGSLRDNPRDWVINRLREFSWDAPDFLRDPVGKLIEWIQDENAVFYTLITDPAQGVRDALNRISHQAYLLVTDPVGYLKGWFVDSLGWSSDFWSDPWREMIYRFTSWGDGHLETISGFVVSFGERLARYFWAREL